MTDEKEKELLELLGAMCNDALEPAQAERLGEMLRSDPKMRQLYSDYLDVHVTLVRRAKRGVSNAADSATLSESYSAPRVTRHRIVRAAAAVAVGLAALLLLSIQLNFDQGPTKVADNVDDVSGSETDVAGDVTTEPRGMPAVTAPESMPLYVAQVTNLTSDVTWDAKSSSQEFLLRVRRGDRIVISSGLVQLDYFGGAQVILHGPCAFVPTGNNSGRLESGELTGQVSQGDFVLTTPTAKVIDLGTEFGVAVDRSAETEVCVFDGEVRVYGGFRGDDQSDSLLLSKGMAARVIGGGQVSEAHDVDLQRFKRALPPASESGDSSEVSLVDILSGSTVGNRRLAGVIAPDTGESDRQPWLREDGPGYSVASGYQPTAWHPFVDGVFIPRENGDGTLVNSSGNLVDLPPSTGRTWGPIWSRRRVPGGASFSAHEDYWGSDSLAGVIDRLSECETGMIGIHANVGVTFDLAAVRAKLDGSPRFFRGIVSNLDNSKIRNPEWAARHSHLIADLRVFVDGELRSSRLEFGRVDGELEIRAELTDEDHFLTIVCTDANTAHAKRSHENPDAYDHVVLIDPVLGLSLPAGDVQ